MNDEDEVKTADDVVNHKKKRNAFKRDYWFNFVVLGLDILFDGFAHKVKKFIIHTNQVGHPDFNRWCKCNFNMMNGQITSDSKWKDIIKIMGNHTGSPIMYRSSHGKIQSLKKEEDND